MEPPKVNNEVTAWLQNHLNDIIKAVSLDMRTGVLQKLASLKVLMQRESSIMMEAEKNVSFLTYQNLLSEVCLVDESIKEIEFEFALGEFEDSSKKVRELVEELKSGKNISLSLIENEMGYVLRYLSKICDKINLDLSEVARKNLTQSGDDQCP